MRPYRWQDPPPPPVQAIRWRRDQFDRFRAEPAEFVGVDNSAAFAPAPVPSMVIEGVEYVEAPEVVDGACNGCCFAAARKAHALCFRAQEVGALEFGAYCDDRRVIYIRKA